MNKTEKLTIEDLMKLDRQVSEIESQKFFLGEDLPLLPFVLMQESSDVDAFRAPFNFPVAMKIVSPEIQHKTEAGGVLLDINDIEEAKRGFNTIVNNVKNYNPEATIQGVLMTPMVRGGIEVIIGMYKNEQLGNIVMFGLGGVYVELFQDVAFRAVPLDREEAKRMIGDTKAIKLLDGFRGDTRKNIDGIVEILLRVSEISAKHECIKTIDLNPVIVKENDVWIVDSVLQF